MYQLSRSYSFLWVVVVNWQPSAAGLVLLDWWEEIGVARALLSSLSVFVRDDVFLVGRYSLVPRPITAENW